MNRGGEEVIFAGKNTVCRSATEKANGVLVSATDYTSDNEKTSKKTARLGAAFLSVKP